MINIQNIVHEVLTTYKATRDSDDLLMAVIYYKYYNISNEPFISIMKHRKEYKLPSYESISRARRKIQELYPDLQGTERIKRIRSKEEADYIDYALNTVS